MKIKSQLLVTVPKFSIASMGKEMSLYTGRSPIFPDRFHQRTMTAIPLKRTWETLLARAHAPTHPPGPGPPLRDWEGWATVIRLARWRGSEKHPWEGSRGPAIQVRCTGAMKPVAPRFKNGALLKRRNYKKMCRSKPVDLRQS